MTKRQFRDYRGVLRDAPSDRATTVATLDEGLIVWSREGNRHRVRYGLQKRDVESIEEASEQFRQCVVHLAACEGRLDD